MTYQESGDIVTGIRKLGPNSRNKDPSLVDAEDRRSRGYEARVQHSNFGTGLTGGYKLAVHGYSVAQSCRLGKGRARK